MTDSAQNALAAKRVGQYLIDAGVLKREQLEEALDRQKRMSKAGFHVLLGTILEEMDAIDRQSLEAIILRQRLDEGSVNLGPEADWGPYRSVVEPPFGATNGQTEPLGTEAPQPQALVDDRRAEAFAPPETAGSTDTETAFEENGEVHPDAADEPAQVATFKPLDDAAFATPSVTTWETTQWKAPEAPVPPPAATSASWGPASEEVQPAELASSIAPSVTEALGSETEMSAPVQDSVAEAHPSGTATSSAAVEQTLDAQSSVVETGTPLVETPVTAETAPSAAVQTTPEAPVNMPQTVLSPSTDDASSAAAVEVMGFRFSRSANGLAQTEVSAVIGQLVRRTRTLEDQMNEAKETLTHLDSMRRYGEQSVKAADTIAEQIRHEAEQQAAVIRDRAQQEARKIVADGRAEHDDILRSAGERAKQVAVDVAHSIDEHRDLNRRMMEQADSLIHGNAEPDSRD